MPWPVKHRFKSIRFSGGRAAPVRGARRANLPAALNPDTRRKALALATQEWRLGGRIQLDESGEHPLRGVRQAGESYWAMAICNEYLLMPQRSLRKLERRCRWKAYHGLLAKSPTLDTLKSWSRRFEWQARALLFDWEDSPEMQRVLIALQRCESANRESDES